MDTKDITNALKEDDIKGISLKAEILKKFPIKAPPFNKKNTSFYKSEEEINNMYNARKEDEVNDMYSGMSEY